LQKLIGNGRTGLFKTFKSFTGLLF